MQLRQSRKLLATLAGMSLVAALGCAFLSFSFAQGLLRWSYDLPFALRSNVATPELCLVIMNEKSARALKQPVDAVWDRRLHTQLVRTLTEAGARAVLLDLIFDAPSSDAAVDEEFAAAIKANGRVFLGAAIRLAPGREVAEEQVIAPLPLLRRAAAGWGLLEFRPVDPDFGVRQIYPGNEEVPAATWRLARHLGASLPEIPVGGAPAQWLNYYAPAGMFQSVDYHQALVPSELAPDFFRNRIVIVGGKKSLGSLMQGKDEFLTPYTRWGQPFAAGLEIHATTLLNLLRSDRLSRMPPGKELWLTLLMGALITALVSIVCGFCPYRAAATAAVIGLLITASACWYVWNYHVWFDWLVIVVVETPAALAWSVSANYVIEARRNAAIQRAFASYLSPHMAREIAEERFSLKPGGKLVSATMMFTDLQGFTELTERIAAPEEMASLLIQYFNNTTNSILKNRGTLIKYIGDAVFAAWGAPLSDTDHAYHAVCAAWDMHQFGKLSVHGHELVTRIGVNTGQAFAGNIGSDFRFDYTLHGDAVNLASRLEGANKHLGTQFLITRSTQEALRGRIVTRRIGKFRVLGRNEAVEIYEVLGPTVSPAIREKIASFEEGVDAFSSGDLIKARACMEKTIFTHGGRDGPSEFYINEIERHETTGLPPKWSGVVDLVTK